MPFSHPRGRGGVAYPGPSYLPSYFYFTVTTPKTPHGLIIQDSPSLRRSCGPDGSPVVITSAKPVGSPHEMRIAFDQMLCCGEDAESCSLSRNFEETATISWSKSADTIGETVRFSEGVDIGVNFPSYFPHLKTVTDGKTNTRTVSLNDFLPCGNPKTNQTSTVFYATCGAFSFNQAYEVTYLKCGKQYTTMIKVEGSRVEASSCVCAELQCNNFKSSQSCNVFRDDLDSTCETNTGSIKQSLQASPIKQSLQASAPTAGNDKTFSKPDTVVTVTVVVVAVVAVLVISGVVVGALLLRRQSHKSVEETGLARQTPTSYSATDSNEADADAARDDPWINA